MPLLIFVAALCSGAAALIFETLWFEQLGLVVGNTVQSSTLVLAAFMGGLGAGYQLASRWLKSLTHPVRGYIAIEIGAALSGAAIFFLLSNASSSLLPLVAVTTTACGGCALVLKPLLAATLLAVPAVLLGMTLPLLVASVRGKYSVSLLYAANTLGACAGALALPLLMGDDVGWNQLALLALALQATAAILVLPGWNRLKTKTRCRLSQTGQQPSSRLNTSSLPIVAAATVGFVILAAEVIWFRALQLEFSGTHDAFSLMLAIVLIGISLGGALNGLLLRWRSVSPSVTLGLLPIALLGGYLAWWSYTPADFSLASLAVSAALLMLPACIVSGALFPQLISLLQQSSDAEATGLLGGYNSWGSASGAVVAGLIFLPLLGLEYSLLLIAGLGLLLCLVWLIWLGRWVPAAAILIAVQSLSFMSMGVTQDKMDSAAAWFAEQDQAEVVAQKEGISDTLQLLQNKIGGQAWHSRVLTNNYSMSGTAPDSQRYMRLFAHLPLAIIDSPKRALLISYGVGSTAQALVSSLSLEVIHVADPSSDMLDMSSIIHGDSNPLLDPRIQVHLQDGRHYLATRGEQFDLITGEPPPPNIAGIKSLYSQEYFELMRQRLSDKGIASYWLPIDQLDLSSAKAVLAAFCNAMESCSLWAGSNYNWIMMGGPGMQQYATDATAQRQWDHPQSALSLKISGVETPEQLAATFIADGLQIGEWLGDHPALVDRYPRRLHNQKADGVALRLYSYWMDDLETEKRFQQSAWVKRNASPLWRSVGAKWFALQPILNNQIGLSTDARVALVADMLSNSELEMPIYWLLGSDYKAQQISAKYINKPDAPADAAYHLAVRALAERKYAMAGQLFELQQIFGTPVTPELTILSYCYAGLTKKAQSVKDRAFGSGDSMNRCW